VLVTRDGPAAAVLGGDVVAGPESLPGALARALEARADRQARRDLVGRACAPELIAARLRG
jgi:hypothetical protein